MTSTARALSFSLTFALLFVGGCSCQTPIGSDGDAGRDGGPLSDVPVVDVSTDVTVVPDVPTDAGPAGPLVVERHGARIYGSVLGVTRIGRTLWLGTSSAIPPETPVGRSRGGLYRIDLDSSDVHVYEAELPQVTEEGVTGAVSTAGVVADGTGILAVARTSIVEIDGDVVTNHPLDVSGTIASPTHVALDRPGSGTAHLWVSTDLGLLDVDPDTFVVREVLDDTQLPGAVTGPLALDPVSHALYAVVFTGGSGTALARIVPGTGPTITVLDRAAEGLTGEVSDVLWSTTLDAAVFSLASFDEDGGGVATWDGTDVTSIVLEGDLGEAATGTAQAFGTRSLAVDDDHGVLVVGGSIRPTGPAGILEGGGLAWIDLSRLSTGLYVTGVSTGTSDVTGDFVHALAVDPQTRRTFASLRQPCSEVRLGNAGVLSIAWDDRTPRFETPLVSGVRDVQVLGDSLVLALRDEIPGARCDGLGVQVGLMEMHAEGSARAIEMRSDRGDGDYTVWRTTRIAPNRIAFRDTDHRLVASHRDDLFFGGATGETNNPALTFGVSLDVRAIAWVDDATFFVGGGTSHSAGDPPTLDNVGPFGISRVTLNDRGGVFADTLFVRAYRDATLGVVEGLPTSEIWDAVADGEGGVYVACGVERMRRPTYDRFVADPFLRSGVELPGAVARIDSDGSIHVVASSAEAPDPRALALDPDGSLWILDAEEGLLHLVGDTVTSETLPETVPATAVPEALFVSANVLVASFDELAVVRIGDVSTTVEDLGWTWRAIERAPNVVALGTDEGLVYVHPSSLTRTPEPSRPAGGPPPFVLLGGGTDVDAGTGDPDAGPALVDAGGGDLDAGACLPAASVCNAASPPCCPGFVCGGSGFARACVPG